jgi:hypothetical protein
MAPLNEPRALLTSARNKHCRYACNRGMNVRSTDLRLGEVLRVRASWSGAWYSHAIHRQRTDSAFHANLTLSVWLIHRFGTDDQDG